MQRIVSLLPSATEILFAVGAGERVVAVTHECDHPPQVAGLPRVTRTVLPTEGARSADIDRHIRRARHEGSSIYALDEAALAALQPDLIVTQELCDVCAVAYDDVRAAVRRLGGDTPVLSLEPENLEDILATIEAVGETTGTKQRAAAVVRGLRDRLSVIASMTAPEPRPRVACLEWTEPLMAGGHWVPDMVALAGGDDVLGSGGRPSAQVSWEQVVEAAPDVIVLMPCGFHLDETVARALEVTGRPRFSDLPCARSGRVVAVDGSAYFNRPGPRIVSGVEILAVAFRVEPGDRLPAGAQWITG